MGRGGRNFPEHLGGRPGDTWNGVDISNLSKHFPGHQFAKFPWKLKQKIYAAKNNVNKKRSINEISTDDNSSTASTLTEAEVAQFRAVMQASRDNVQPQNSQANPQATLDAASAFGRNSFPPGLPSPRR